MAVAVAIPPVPAAQPAPPQAAAPALVGRLDGREIANLESECYTKDAEGGRVVKGLNTLAALVVGVWVALAVTGFTGFLAGIAVFAVGGTCLDKIYDAVRNRDYQDAGLELRKPGFQRYVNDHGLELSILSIREVHKAYSAYLHRQARAAAGIAVLN
ncbi:MAG TPA: hypothetical protein VLF94_06585 [Chlamydiales bacterium]|nr:hypothetical protein [Chlamydiales bacterium]